MVIVVVPVPVILESVTEIVSITVLPFLMIILPLSRSTASLKVSTISAPTETPVASSLGFEEDRVGGAVSAAVNVET